jgi:hypothetical protein
MSQPRAPQPYAAPDPEQRLAEALRAHASQPGGSAPHVPGPTSSSTRYQPSPLPPQQRTGGRGPGPDASRPAPTRTFGPILWPLLIALLAGAVLGCGLALISILLPGVLPTIG